MVIMSMVGRYMFPSKSTCCNLFNGSCVPQLVRAMAANLSVILVNNISHISCPLHHLGLSIRTHNNHNHRSTSARTACKGYAVAEGPHPRRDIPRSIQERPSLYGSACRLSREEQLLVAYIRPAQSQEVRIHGRLRLRLCGRDGGRCTFIFLPIMRLQECVPSIIPK